MRWANASLCAGGGGEQARGVVDRLMAIAVIVFVSRKERWCALRCMYWINYAKVSWRRVLHHNAFQTASMLCELGQVVSREHCDYVGRRF